MGLEPPALVSLPPKSRKQIMQKGNIGSEGLAGSAGASSSCTQDSSTWGVLQEVGVLSGINPLQSKQCVRARTHITQGYLSLPLNPHSFEQSPSARSQERKHGTDPPGSPGQLRELRTRLGTWTRAAVHAHMYVRHTYVYIQYAVSIHIQYQSHLPVPLLPLSIFGDCFRERNSDLRL